MLLALRRYPWLFLSIGLVLLAGCGKTASVSDAKVEGGAEASAGGSGRIDNGGSLTLIPITLAAGPKRIAWTIEGSDGLSSLEILRQDVHGSSGHVASFSHTGDGTVEERVMIDAAGEYAIRSTGPHHWSVAVYSVRK